MNSRQFAIIYLVFCLNWVCLGQDPSLAPNDIRRQVVCIWETFDADCGQDKVLLIDEAFLGRMHNSNRCSIDLGSDELCFADVQLFAERKCSGRRRCSFKPIDDNLEFFSGNCSHRAEKFMSIAYRCQEVYSGDNDTCKRNRSLVVTSSSGYLSNAVAEEWDKGLSLCPWRFQPRERQTVVLTLLDFGVWKDRNERSRHHTCRIYAWIRHLQPNTQTPANIPICGGDERERLIQRTTTTVEVQMTKQENQSSANKVYFLIRFQTVECSEIDVPLGADVETLRQGIRITCVDDRQSFLDLRCEAGHWIPEINFTCSTFSIDPLPSFPASLSSSSSSTSSSYSEFSPTEVESLKGHKEDSSSISWEKYLVTGGLLSLAVVVVIIVVVMCRNRRIDRKGKSERCVTPFADNNTYDSGQLMIGGGIYEEIADGNLLQTPESSSSDSVPGAKINSTMHSRNDPLARISPDSLSGGPLPPCPRQCTDPSAADPTYLVPREEEMSSILPQPFTKEFV